MGGVKPPRDWLQRQKRSLLKKVLLFDIVFLMVILVGNYLYLKGLFK